MHCSLQIKIGCLAFACVVDFYMRFFPHAHPFNVGRFLGAKVTQFQHVQKLRTRSTRSVACPLLKRCRRRCRRLLPAVSNERRKASSNSKCVAFIINLSYFPFPKIHIFISRHLSTHFTTMIIPIKTLKPLKTGESSFTMEIDSHLTIDDLKQNIEQQYGKDHYPAQDQTLIYGGRILEATEKLDDCKIDPKKFVVLMVNRHAPPQTQASSQQEATKPQPKQSQQPLPQNQTQKAATSQSQQATQGATPQVPSQQPLANPTAALTTSATGTAQSQARGRETRLDASMASRLGVLVSQPQFRQLQHLVQQNPHLLSSTIEALADSNPDLYNFISDNPDAFVSALNQPIIDRQPASRAAGVREQPGILDLISNITQQDKEAIGRLKELGFSEDMAAQAYMACNKDEQMAANLLFQMDQ